MVSGSSARRRRACRPTRRTRAGRSAVDVEPGRGELASDVLVAAGVLGEAVDEQDRRPRLRRPAAASAGRAAPCRRGPVTVSVVDVVIARHRRRADRYAAAHVRLDRGRDRVFVRRYAFFDQNIGVVRGDDGVLVVDTRVSHRQADEILADLRELTPLPVRAVVNTHGHNDHAFGNHRFRPAPIWGHARCASG